MGWLRLDDGFASHPKIAALTDRELRVWMRLLCWCSRHDDPTVDKLALREVPGLNTKAMNRYTGLGLVDVEGKSHVVHDWLHYQPKDPTGADRQARWRANRDENVTATVTALPVTPALPRARAHARSRPVPREEPKGSSRKPDEIWDALVREMGTKPETKSERGRWNRAVSEIREAGATADDVERRAREYRRRWPDISLTVSALATNWGSLQPKSTGGAPCADCGVGGGHHAEDCPVVAVMSEADMRNLGARIAEHRG